MVHLMGPDNPAGKCLLSPLFHTQQPLTSLSFLDSSIGVLIPSNCSGSSAAPDPAPDHHALHSSQQFTWRVPVLKPLWKHCQASYDVPKLATYNGASCSCTVDDQLKDNSLEGPSPRHTDTACAIATVLGFSFSRLHQYLICLKCKIYVPLSDFDGHMGHMH